MAIRPILDPSSPWFEKCSRHTSAYTCRILQDIYLCDPCCARLTREALNDRPFIYHGEIVSGYCGLCNEVRDVQMRQHFGCTRCWPVVLSYQKGFVASQAVHDFWRRTLQPRLPGLRMEETEPMVLEPYAKRTVTKKEAAKGLMLLDFRVSDQNESLFHVELKSGPASIDTMPEFQLDVNDYDDIIGASVNTGLPSYVFHVQLQLEYRPPTRGTRAVGIWWTDFYRLRKSLKAVRQRRGEDKSAGYFDTQAFEPIETFVAEVQRAGYRDLAEHLSRDDLGLPSVLAAPNLKNAKALRRRHPSG